MNRAFSGLTCWSGSTIRLPSARPLTAITRSWTTFRSRKIRNHRGIALNKSVLEVADRAQPHLEQAEDLVVELLGACPVPRHQRLVELGGGDRQRPGRQLAEVVEHLADRG